MSNLTDDERNALRAAGLDIDAEDEPITLAVFATVERIVADRERAARADERVQQADRLTNALHALGTLPSNERRRGKEEGVKLALSYIREDQRLDGRADQ